MRPQRGKAGDSNGSPAPGWDTQANTGERTREELVVVTVSALLRSEEMRSWLSRIKRSDRRSVGLEEEEEEEEEEEGGGGTPSRIGR
ncbi:hypothetical protein VTN49DRAFT_5051 [Thermomyces lanuginosus]|uniref:uncharacterized protein n=1 Tax=Thermomyces lanuginosus TaxID=5541 RepID=UPI003741F13F